MGILKKILVKIAGRKLKTETGEISEISRTKIIAVLAVLSVAIEKISTAWGHPVTIPPELFEILGAAGLWTLRDAVK